MVVLGLSSRCLTASSEVFAVSPASCVFASGVAGADLQPMPDEAHLLAVTKA